MPVQLRLSLSPTPKRKVMVISHERSGTHFMMNSLELNLGYVGDHWLNLDFELGINFHEPRALRALFAEFKGRPMRNLVKSHHPFAFLEPLYPDLADEFQVIYMCRHPEDVLLSYQRFLNTREHHEGPRCATIQEFMRRPPEGAMMRYQKHTLPNLVARWREHVAPWVEAAGRFPGITVVRYEDLNLRFEATMGRVAEVLHESLPPLRRPDPGWHVYLPGEGKVAAHRHLFSEDDRDFLRQEAGPILARLYPE